MATKKAGAKTTARKAAKKAVAPKAARPGKQLPGALDSPDKLQERLESLTVAWKTAASEPSTTNVDRLAKLSADLEEAARGVREHAEALSEAARISALSLKRIQAGVPAVATEEVETLESTQGKTRLFEEEDEVQERATSFDVSFDTEAAKPAEPDMPLESFFDQVSKSVVRAQQRLDMQSLAYAQELKDSPVPPSLFSIPKVTAEIKLGLSVQKNSNILVTLFGKPENTTNFSESTVSFDVVASAPPPGGAGLYTAPIPSFLVVGMERDSVAAAIQKISQAIKAKTGVDLSGAPAGWLPSAVIFRGSESLAPASRAEYLFVKRSDNASQALFTVRFNTAKPDDAKITNVSDNDLRLAMFDIVMRIQEWEASITLPKKA